MSFIFLPGTIIHEISHAIIAKILFVRVGRIELMPHLNGESLKLGSVEVAKSDVLRDFLIGAAPFFAGVTILITILYYSLSKNILGLNVLTAGVIYLIFAVSNTMYSSSKDMERAIEFFVIIVVLLSIFYFLGVRFDANYVESLNLENYLGKAVPLMAIPIIIDLLIIFFAKILNKN